MKKVLIALDYDPTAQKVAELGYALANAMGAEAILLHVVLDETYYSSTKHITVTGFTSYLDQTPVVLENGKDPTYVAQKFLEKSKLHLGDKKIQTMIAEGNLTESILKAAKDLNADVIVMGSHSRKWLENITMGSVTRNVLSHTTVPLLIIPTKKTD